LVTSEVRIGATNYTVALDFVSWEHKGRRTPTHGYGATREEALQAFARSWQKE
jgi:hypothetical protein